MKKALYFILLSAELFIGSLLMISLWNSSLYIPVLITAAVLVALLVWQIILLTKTADTNMKRKILTRIALILVIPSAVFVATYIIVAIAFIVAFI